MNRKLMINVDRFKKEITEKEKNIVDKTNNNKCAFCGINTNKYSHYHYKNDTWHNSCSLCYYSENLDNLIALNKGKIAFIPEIDQEELFNLLRMIWFVKELYNNSKNNDHLEEIYDSVSILDEAIKDRTEVAETLFSNGASDVNILVNYLHSQKKEIIDKNHLPLKYLRWIPNENIFKDEIEYWNKKDLKKYHPKNFKAIIKQMEKKNNG
jgi:hypothetical protein